MTDHLEDYILSHIDKEPQLLQTMFREANVKLLHPRMLSGHLQGRLLKMFTQMIRPHHVLELGTYTGYSALCIAEGLSNDALLHTIEVNDEMEDFINKYVSRSPQRDKIKLYIGDAVDIIPTFEDEMFEMVFIDADKRIYWKYFEMILPKVAPRGFILVDNTLWDGKVVEPVDANDWQTKGILDFNERIAKDERVTKVILPLRDGITLIRKN